MIIVGGSPSFSIDLGRLTPLERSIYNEKNNSQAVYRYSTPEQLYFELKLRSNIVEAAYALSRSGAQFAVFEDSRCNPQYWTRNSNGGFMLNPGVKPSAGIRDIFNNGHLYAFECATAIVITLYYAVMNAIGERNFNVMFTDLLLYDWHYDEDLRLSSSFSLAEAYPGDVLYFKNPAFNPRTPEWQGMNVVLLDYDTYYGHGPFIESSQYIINMLNRHRKPLSMRSAYLTDQIVSPDYIYLSQFATNRSVLGKIGRRIFNVS